VTTKHQGQLAPQCDPALGLERVPWGVSPGSAARLPQLSAWIAERHVFVFTTALFVALALAGFVPSSLAKIEAVQAGQRPPFPIVLHAHATLMGAWLLLLLAQSVLAGTGRRNLHRILGIAGAVIAPAIVLSGALLIGDIWSTLWSPIAVATMPAQALEQARTFVTNILLVQGRALLVFTVCVVWALRLRRRDPDMHKRLMLLGTAVPLLAGVDRLTAGLGWTTMPASPLSLDLYLILSVLPLLAWDLLRRRQVHAATRAWVAMNLPLAVATNLLWNSNWWLVTAPRLMGVN
jgi:hypothetical protein